MHDQFYLTKQWYDLLTSGFASTPSFELLKPEVIEKWKDLGPFDIEGLINRGNITGYNRSLETIVTITAEFKYSGQIGGIGILESADGIVEGMLLDN